MRRYLNTGFFGLLFLHICQYSAVTASRCRFPQEWRGRYFQSGLGEIVIRESVITTKGACIEQSRDYFLFDNRDAGCFHCLLLLRQHKNIIQYKESYCTSPASLKTVCAQIRVETPLYTLVREPSQPVRCPFQEAYYFNYNDLLHGSCDRATSYAKPCASHTRYQLRFNHCVDSAAYNGRDLDMECLAFWKDGSETYFYSRLNGPGITAKDDRYRCFKYQHYGNEVSLAMSADATCRGLRSATDGPFLLEFTKDNSGFPPPSCNFPDWLRDITWRDLSGQHRYSLGEDPAVHSTLYGYSNISQRSGGHAHAAGGSTRQHHSLQFRCRHSARIDDGEYLIHAFVIHNCISKYQCLKFKRLAHRAVEFHQGPAVDHDSYTDCPTEEYKTVQLLTAEDSSTLTSCPRPGVHHTAPSVGCLDRLNVGCHNESSIEIHHSCGDGDAGVSLNCVVSWTGGTPHRTFVIVQQKHLESLSCYSFRQGDGGTVIFGEDPACSSGLTSSAGSSEGTTGQATPSKPYTILRHENCRRDTRPAHTPKKDTQTSTTPPTTSTTTTKKKKVPTATLR